MYILGAHHRVPKSMHSATQCTYLVPIIGCPNLCTRPLNLHTSCPSLGAQIYALGHSIYILDALDAGPVWSGHGVHNDVFWGEGIAGERGVGSTLNGSGRSQFLVHHLCRTLGS